ncbi:MAG: PAS domain-containing protein [Proteobacteria bacterium]|nr:PAS domain-containing protein [Pseudomonadota bacterium]
MARTATGVNRAPKTPAKAKPAPAAKPRGAAEPQAQLAAIRGALAVLELGPDLTVLDANENFCRLLGYSLEEIKGRPHSMFLEPTQVASADHYQLWERLRGGASEVALQRRVGKGNTELWLNVVCVPVPGADGRPAKFVELCSDASREHAALEEVRAELKVRTDIMNVTSIVSEADLKGDIVSFNDKYVEISRYTRQELLGSPHSITRHPDMPKEAFKEMWSTIGRGGIFRGVIKNRTKDGNPYYVDAVIAPILGKKGKPRKYLGVRYDITAAEIERQNMKGILDALSRSQAIIEFKLDGTILTANDNFCRTMGYSLDELRGKHHSIFVEPAIVTSPEYRAFWDKLGRGEFDAGQYKRLGKGGQEVWLRASYNPVCDEMGRPFKVVKCASDVSDGVRTSLAMKQTVEQTQQLVAAAVGGDLTGRLDLTGKGGELRKLAEGINALMDTTATGIDEVVRMLGALAGGDLTQRISKEFHGSFGRMKDDANATAEKLTEALSRINESTETINTAAAEIASGNADLSQRTEEQASSLEETASSMEQLTSTVKQNADNARQANQLAATASEVALKGGQVVSQVVTTMSSINDSSKKIVDIISVIDGIAFQTNILALNAAVEAARAGEQGRGFAVVASEVRNLAQRSAAAAKEIKALIGDSVEKVDAGSKLVEAAGKTMDDIVSSVRRVTDIMGEITSASREQSAGIEQVHQAITQMDQVTQQNAALVEEAAAASESMREQASNLREAVHSFRLTDGAAPPAWDGVERRGPNRATNVSRIAPSKVPARVAAGPAVARRAEAATGTDGPDDGWEQF